MTQRSVSQNDGMEIQADTVAASAATLQPRKVAVLVAEGVNIDDIYAVRAILHAAGIEIRIIGSHVNAIHSAEGKVINVDLNLGKVDSSLFDGVFIPGGECELHQDAHALLFIKQAYKYGKVIAAAGAGSKVLQQAALSSSMGQFLGEGLFVHSEDEQANHLFFKQLVDALSVPREFERPDKHLIEL